MNIFGAFLFTEDVVKFALGVAIITSVVFIIWILLREMRLWYWKINNLLKMLRHIEKRIRQLEMMVEGLSQEVISIGRSTDKMSNIFDSAVINTKQKEETEIEDEEKIAEKIRD